MRAWVVASLVILAGCAGVDQAAKEAREMRGRPIQDAIARYGYPTDQREIAGDTVYSWRTDYGALQVVPCTLRLVVGTDGKVKHSEVAGSDNACANFVR